MPGAVTIRVRSGSSPLRERPAVEDILGQFGKSGHELGIRHYERICPDFVKVMIFFVYGKYLYYFRDANRSISGRNGMMSVVCCQILQH